MAKIDRALMRIFGIDAPASAGGVGVFGSLANGSVQYSKQPPLISSLSQYNDGWSAGVVGDNAFAIEDFNALCYLFSYQLSYLLQAGIAEWDFQTTYYIGSLASDGVGNFYVSLTDTNTNNALTDTTNWRLVSDLLSPQDAQNYRINTSVGSNAFSITVRNMDTNSPMRFSFSEKSGSNCIFSSVYQNTMQLTVSSGSTLGQVSGVSEPLYYYVIKASSTSIELAVSTTLFGQTGIVTTVAEGGAGGADDRYTMYSATARSNVPFRLIGKSYSTQATAGTWATNVSAIQILPVPLDVIIQSRQTTFTGGGALNQYNDFLDITLAPGKYLISASSSFDLGTMTSPTSVVLAVSTTSGNSVTGALDGVSIFSAAPPTSAHISAVIIPPYQVEVSSTTTFYLKIRMNASTGAAQVAAAIQAERLDM